MTRPVGEYFAHRMRESEYAAAYCALADEDQAERARISARLRDASIPGSPVVQEILRRYPRLLDLLALLNWLPQPALRVAAPGQVVAHADDVFQLSGEVHYDIGAVSTEVTDYVDVQ